MSAKPTIFEYLSTYPCSAAALHAWHSREGALERLLPPWERTRVISRKGGLDPGGEVRLKMRAGLIRFNYLAHHVENIPGVMFRDIQAKGPFTSWSHSHFFSDKAEGALLRDFVEYRLPLHDLLPGFLHREVQKRLRQMFVHRETTLQADIRLHNYCSQRPLRLLISGASGVLGRELVPLLTTGGHTIYRLVRREPDKSRNEIFWDPEQGLLNPPGWRIYRAIPLDRREKGPGAQQPCARHRAAGQNLRPASRETAGFPERLGCGLLR